MPQLMGFPHIDLTVSDCERTAVRWQEMVGFKLVNQGRIEAHEFRSMVHPSGLAVTVLTHDGTAKATPSMNSASASITWHSESRIKANYSDGSHISMRWVSLIRESSTSVSVPLWSSDIRQHPTRVLRPPRPFRAADLKARVCAICTHMPACRCTDTRARGSWST
jgi:hypothetical protein